MIELTESLLAKLGGWEAMKAARAIAAAGGVAAAEWNAPELRGTVNAGGASYRAGLRIRSASDADNLCPCRDSRQRGLICAHSLAVGLQLLQPAKPVAAPQPAVTQTASIPGPVRKLRRDPAGRPVQLAVILPPNLPDAIAKDRIMVCVEASSGGKAGPLDCSPQAAAVALEPDDEVLLDALERVNGGDTPAQLLLNARQFAEILPALGRHPRVTLGRGARFEFSLGAARPAFHLGLAGGLAVLQGELDCRYGVRSAKDLKPDAPWLEAKGNPLQLTARDFSAEQAAAARLLRAGFTGPDREGRFHMKGQEAVLNFFARDFPGLQRDWKVTLEERLERSTGNLERIEPHFNITASGEQWFDLHVAYTGSGGTEWSAADIQRLLRSGQSHQRLPNGKIALLDTSAVGELEQTLADASPRQVDGAFRLPNAQAGFLDATLRARPGWEASAPADWNARAAMQRGEIKPAALALGELESVLRPYQKDGVAWLNFLRANGFGGVLADEMGLGKTLQVLAFLQALKANKELSAPALVVCPTSLVFNWEAEAAKFTPGLRTLALHGPERQRKFATLAECDLIITSYAVLRRDAGHYRDLEFDTVILDEAQHIKNRQTQNAQSVKAVRSRRRLVLTGTPMENSVLDLWSIFDFLMPGYLGAAADFRDRYELPIARDRDAATQARLARRVRPFLLRRLKRSVAADLPEKIEQISFCELNESQKSLYQEVLSAGRKEMAEGAGAQGKASSRMAVLTALLRLRQICCDARLLDIKLPDAAPPSGKTELFLELIGEAVDGGHRVLVFSQFTRMLRVLADELEAQGIAHCYLDGETRDRAAVVEKFQRDDAIPVFLISLKAGGVGLNLTGADTVVHFDPWWNPAVEAQATDRAHRIGQKRVVTSYKLIARGTVEEKILLLQQRKRGLAEAMLGGEEQFLQSLSWSEIESLLEA